MNRWSAEVEVLDIDLLHGSEEDVYRLPLIVRGVHSCLNFLPHLRSVSAQKNPTSPFLSEHRRTEKHTYKYVMRRTLPGKLPMEIQISLEGPRHSVKRAL